MAKTINKVELLGRVGADPEMRYTHGGTAVTQLRLATDRVRKGGENETDWHSVVVWDKLADAVANYVEKGQRLYVSGSRAGVRQDLGKFELRAGSGPDGVPAATEQLGPQAQYCLSPHLGPAHPRLFEPCPDYPLAGALHRAAAYGITLGAELSVAHSMPVGLEVVNL